MRVNEGLRFLNVALYKLCCFLEGVDFRLRLIAAVLSVKVSLGFSLGFSSGFSKRFSLGDHLEVVHTCASRCGILHLVLFPVGDLF